MFAELAQAVAATAQEIEQAKVSEDLELLADFVAHVPVPRMESRQTIRVRINIRK